MPNFSIRRKGEDHYRLRIYEWNECQDLPNLRKPICNLDEGVLTSILEERTEKEFIVEERMHGFGNGVLRI